MTSAAAPDPPGHLHDLMEGLLSHGFEEVQSEYAADRFGNVVRVFERKPVRVRLVRDRDEWSAELTAAGWPAHSHFGEEWILLPPLITASG